MDPKYLGGSLTLPTNQTTMKLGLMANNTAVYNMANLNANFDRYFEVGHFPDSGFFVSFQILIMVLSSIQSMISQTKVLRIY